MSSFNPKSTKAMKAVNESMVMDVCAEKNCGITIYVDKEDKDNHRKNRCMACIMRSKLRGKLPQ